MAKRKTTKQSEFNLLFPSLVLSIVALLLVVVVTSLPEPTNTVFVEAAEDLIISDEDDINSLENDLILLQVDNLVEEETVLSGIE